MNEHTKGRDVSGFKLDLHGAFMRRTSLRGAMLARANFELADCRGADFSNSDLSGAKLTGANFSNALLIGCELKDTDFRGTDLRGADLTNAANLTRVQLQSAIVDDTTILPGALAA